MSGGPHQALYGYGRKNYIVRHGLYSKIGPSLMGWAYEVSVLAYYRLVFIRIYYHIKSDLTAISGSFVSAIGLPMTI